MILLLKIIIESFRQAFQQLISNKLRSFLTLLGITIGIFCVIAVLSSVDSLQDNILQSFEKLGNDVIYIDKQPWNEDPGNNYWKYLTRPNLSYQDLKAIEARSKMAEAASLMVFIPGKLLKHQNNFIQGAYVAGITEDYNKVVNLDFEHGSYFSPSDFQTGRNAVLLGAKLAEELFPDGNSIAKEVKLFGQYFTVVGVLKKEGKSIIDVMPYDEAVLITWNTAKKIININSNSNWGTLLSVKAKRGSDINEMKYELASILRPVRGLRPKDKDNFSINEVSLLTGVVKGVFGGMNAAGFFIGMFSMLVGAFGVANIMFVSVRERTSIIGIKMALGAKRYFILLEYLIEAIALCIVGGVVGLILVTLVLFVVSKAVEFEISMSVFNIFLGLLFSIIIGIIAGIIPAIHASRMDPVEAIRK
ncbi:MAG TPA: ABC transporter permease [Saprospiraceae bacterium]|nr:ABC transporter permease [Saprospiraceae bacterium]